MTSAMIIMLCASTGMICVLMLVIYNLAVNKGKSEVKNEDVAKAAIDAKSDAAKLAAPARDWNTVISELREKSGK